ncbi:MAG: hypothetical protein ACE5JF_10625 [Anaerolineales bacterium]
MTSGSGFFPHEPSARGWRWPVAFSILSTAACLNIVACARPTTPNPTPSPATPNIVASQPLPTPTAPPPTRTAIPEHRIGLGAPDYEDNFESDYGWETGASARGAVSRLDGKLAISVQGPSSTLSSLSPADPLADFFVEIEVHSEICEAGDEFGLMVRTGGRGNPRQDSHYRFLITCDGTVRASRFLSGVEAPIQPITPSADVLPGAPAVNRIGVSAIGDEFHFFVNDRQVFQLEDGEIPTGRIGVIVRARRAAQTTVSFDEFRVWDLASS